MLQRLLIERFHLATHWETRTEPVYRLVVLPGGPKMAVADEGYGGSELASRWTGTRCS